jgi:hypothetical protein
MVPDHPTSHLPPPLIRVFLLESVINQLAEGEERNIRDEIAGRGLYSTGKYGRRLFHSAQREESMETKIFLEYKFVYYKKNFLKRVVQVYKKKRKINSD